MKKTLLFFVALSLMLASCDSASSQDPVPTADVNTSVPITTPTIVPTVTPVPPQYEFHVAVDGSDTNPGTVNRPFATLEHARDVIRTMNLNMQESIVVHIHGGAYFVSEPIEFTDADSGQNGFDIIYRAAEGETPVISGGINVSGWEQVPDSQMWKTVLQNVGAFRQLYVNGVRAQRAVSQKTVTGIRWVAGDASKHDGIVISSTKMPDPSRPRDLELHWILDWMDMRLLVKDVEKNSDGTKTIWMQQPWYSYALSMGEEMDNNHDWMPAYDNPFYLENAIELLDEHGEWYYNADTHELFYLPRDVEDMKTATIVIPQTQMLLKIKGDGFDEREVHNLAFESLSFQYAGWTRANERGTFGHQAQDLMVTPGWCDECREMTPAHVQVNYARNIRFEGCRFEHLGAVGLHLNTDVHDVTVQGNLFRDISDGAMVFGHWEHVYAMQSKVTRNNLIANNLITDVGVEYWGAPSITAYYTNHVQIVHNEISNAPYTGISIGWGWSSWTDSKTAHDNLVAYNLITDITQRARDGGGIYTLSHQPNTVIEGNVIRRMKGDYACLYADEGSAFFTFQNNVCDTAPAWLQLWTDTIHDISILNTYTNVQRMKNHGANIQIENTVYINGQEWTPEAQAIIDNAGLEPLYTYLHEWIDE